MRTHTSEFKEELKVFGRQIQGKIIYYPSYDLVSESNDNILTEADLQIISEQANYNDPTEIDAEDIFSISIIKNGDLLQSLMKEFDFETKVELNIGSVVNPQFGLLVDEDYEYLNYGNYIINSKEFNMDTETWSYVCYDKMLFSMVKYRELNNIEYPITIKQFINKLCDKVGLEFEDSEFVNQDQLIYEDLYKNRDVTYRDIFDEISKIVAGNLLINDSDKLEVGYPNKASYSENSTGSDISIEAVEEPILDVKLEGNTQQNTSILPSGYTQVDYIEGHKAEYIDTGFKATPKTRVEATFQFTQVTPVQQRIFGNGYSETDGLVFTTYINGGGNFAWACQNNTGNWVNTGITADTNKHTFIVDSLNNSVSIDNYNATITTTRTNNSVTTMLLFTYRDAEGVAVGALSYLKMYSTKIYDNNVLVRDFIPCYRNSDNVVGLYDLVNNTFYTNQGTGSFTYGSVVDIPNPEYSQNINVVTGEQNVKIRGNNLYNYKDTINVSQDVTVDNEGWITVSYDNTSGTSNVYENYFTNNLDLKLNTRYAIFCEIKNVEGNGNLNLISHFNNQGQFNANPAYEFSTLNNNEIKKTIATTYSDSNRTNGLRTYVRFNTGVSGSITFRISIVENVDLSINDFVYEPYFEPQNYPLSLGNIELCKIGNYQDYIYNQNGDWYLHKEIGKVILNGGSNEIYDYQNNNRFWLRRPYWTDETVPKNPVDGNLQGLYCNRFKEVTRGQTWTGVEGISYDNPNTNPNYPPIGSTFDIACNSIATTESNFKTWLSNNPLEIVYILQNPQDIQITDATLIQQLDNLKNATLFNGVNNISTSGNLPSILNLDYISEYESINEDYLKDTNVRMSEKVGVINSVAILDSDNNLQYVAEDTQSIKANEMTRITITDNLIAMNGETQTIANNILSKLNGLYYYINDLETTGVCYYDFLDLFNVEARGNTYQCLLLNNEITITQGIEEHIFTEKFEELETSANEYTTSVMTNKQIQFNINQQEGRIESKVEKDGVISAINQSAEEIQINANKLSFEGATIDMTADNVKIQGENLSIDSAGTITLNDNSAASSLSSETLHSAYLIESEDSVVRQGTTETLKFKNEIVANGRKAVVEDSWEYEGTTGGSISGITERLYSQPQLTLYSQSQDYDVSSGTGSYQSLNIGLNSGINYESVNNGTTTTPLIITSTGNITCVRLTQTSKEENKKNFEKLTNAKDILNQVDIYKYNFKDEEDNTKKSIGFVIGDDFNYSQEITSENNDGANIYSMVSVLWQVVKDYVQIIDKQQEEIKELKEMIKYGKY